jgi:hypothetical protein
MTCATGGLAPADLFSAGERAPCCCLAGGAIARTRSGPCVSHERHREEVKAFFVLEEGATVTGSEIVGRSQTCSMLCGTLQPEPGMMLGTNVR